MITRLGKFSVETKGMTPGPFADAGVGQKIFPYSANF